MAEQQERIEDVKEVLIILANIKEGGIIERFKFTSKEVATLDFIYDALKENLEEIK